MALINRSSNRISFLDILFCFFLVTSSGTLFSTEYPYALYGIVVVFCLMLIKGRVRFLLNLKKTVPVIIALMCLSFIQFFLFSEGDDISLVFKNFLLILIVFCVAYNNPERNISRLRAIVWIIIGFCFISNSIFIYHVFGGGLEFSSTQTSENAMHFHYLEQICGNTLIGLAFRNGGIYYEPGMYQIYLNLALLFILYDTNIRFRLLLVVYLLLTITSTFSVSGYATASVIIGLYVVKNNYNSFLPKLLVLCAFIIGFIYLSPYLKESFELKSETSSAEIRGNDLTVGIDVFLTSPVVGFGIVNHEYAKVSKQFLGEKRDSTNGMVNLLISFGMLGAILFLLCVKGVCRWLRVSLTPKVVIGFLIWLVISINTESIVLHPLLLFIIGVGANFYLEAKSKKAQINKSSVNV